MRCLSPCAAANGDQPPGLQGALAVADIAFISPERLDQVEMIGADAPPECAHTGSTCDGEFGAAVSKGVVSPSVSS